MRQCLKCNKEVHPIQELQEDMRVLDVCPSCTSVFAAPEPVKATPQPVAVEAIEANKLVAQAESDDEDEEDEQTIELDFTELGFEVLLQMAQARLDWIDEQLAQYEALRAEREKVARMIAANKPS